MVQLFTKYHQIVKYLLQAAKQDLAGLALEHQQTRTKFLQVNVKIRQTLEQEPDPVQPGPARPDGERGRIRLHVVRVDHEHRVQNIRPFSRVVQCRVVVDTEPLSEPHQRV